MLKQSRLDKQPAKTYQLAIHAGIILAKIKRFPRLCGLMRAVQEALLCMLLARATIFDGFSPFSVAMVGAYCAQGRGYAAVLGAFGGYLLFGQAAASVGNCAAALLTLACSHICADFELSQRRWFMPMVSAVCMGACSFVFLPAFSIQTAALFLCGLTLTFGAGFFYLTALTPPQSCGDLLKPGAAIFLTASILIAAYDLTIGGGIAPARTIALLIIMGVSFVCGSAAGAAAGVAFGVTMDAAVGRGAFFSCTYGFGALIGGMFHGAPKAAYTAIYLCAGAAAALLGANNPIFLPALAESALAAAIFAILPKQLWEVLKETFVPQPQEMTDSVRQLRENAQKYAAGAAEAFYQMYLGLANGFHSNNEEARAVFDKAADHVCRKCILCASCWEKNYITTVDTLNGVTAPMLARGQVQAEDFPQHFKARCMKFPEFLKAANDAMMIMQQRREYQRRCAENKSLIAQQYAGVAGILQQLGTGFIQQEESLPARQRQVRRYAAAFGKIDRAAVYQDSNQRLRIELGGDGIDRIMQEAQGFTAGLAALLSVGLTEPEELEDELGRRLIMREQAPYRAILGVAQRKKEGEKVSGDTIKSFVADDGNACLLLSDGMGTGENAAHDSKRVLGQIERFLRAGVCAQEALRAVAPAYQIQSEGTRFVTLDALTADLFSGQAESLKCGAAPSYLKTTGGITRILSHCLPVGLMENEPDTVPLKLGHGDVFVMVSDGVTDGTEDGWLLDVLAARAADGPKALATQIIASARQRGCTDDLSALVLRLEKNKI